VRTEGPAGRVRKRAAAVLSVPWRQVALGFVPAGLLLLIPLSLLGGGTSTGGRLATVTAVAALTVAVAVLVAVGFLQLWGPHLWIALMACVLIISFAFPLVQIPVTLPSERHRVVDLVGALRGLAPTQLTRLTDFVGMLAGLALLAVSIVAPPRARHLTRVIALTGAVAAGYVLFHGTYANGRLEGLSCNPNYLGSLLSLPLVASVGAIRYARNAKWLIPAAVCFVAMADTQSRGAFLAAAAGVAVILIQGRSVQWQAIIVLALGIPAVVMLGANFHVIENLGASDRAAADLSANNGLRFQAAELAVRVAIQHPLRGVGYWMFPTYAARSGGFGVYIMTHNDYLRLAAEAGVLALVAFLVLIWLGTARRRCGDLAVLRAVVVAYAVGLLFANPLAILGVSAPFWVALGCLLAGTPERETARPHQACPAIVPADRTEARNVGEPA
jgi:O-antigen ligase